MKFNIVKLFCLFMTCLVAMAEHVHRNGTKYGSYINPNNEYTLKNIISKKFPDVNISLSSDISPLIREYERMSKEISNEY